MDDVEGAPTRKRMAAHAHPVAVAAQQAGKAVGGGSGHAATLAAGTPR